MRAVDTRSDVPQFDQTSASQAVLIEVGNVPGALRDHLALINCWREAAPVYALGVSRQFSNSSR